MGGSSLNPYERKFRRGDLSNLYCKNLVWGRIAINLNPQKPHRINVITKIPLKRSEMIIGINLKTLKELGREWFDMKYSKEELNHSKDLNLS